MPRYLERLALAIVGLALIRDCAAADIKIFSPGMTLPETISLAPTGFGAYGGSYFIPDADNGNIYVVPPSGGSPGILATDSLDTVSGGLFLPANWGANAGNFATVGYLEQTGRIYTYDATGASSLFKEVQNTTYITPMIAPNGFGSYGGNMLITADGQRGLVSLAPDGTVTTIVQNLSIRPFGLAYAPAGFGAVGGMVLVSSSVSGDILAVAASGTTSAFGTIPLVGPDQSGLRQMAFSPAGFLSGYGSLLFVSVTGSDAGGGTLGDVVALDGSGNIVADLRQDLGLTKFDPRGLLFDDQGDLFISDASDAILLATAADFQLAGVPEPATLALAACALAVLGLVRLRLAATSAA